MKDLAKRVYYYFSLVWQSLFSVVCMIFFSSYKNSLKIKKQNNRNSCCKVLGNGPSLRKEFDNNLDQFQNIDNDVFCVNFFCEDPLFYEIKPFNYVIADNIFWKERKDEYTIKMQDIFFNCMNKVDWNLNLFIPNDSFRYLKKCITNKNVNLIPYNRTPVDGFKSVRHFIYKKNMGMPRPVNILNAALFLAVNMGYKKVNLYGADHSWISDLFVDDENNVCCYQSHFYGEKTTFKMARGSLALGLRSIADALDSYKLIKTYAESVNCAIINKTIKSFVDIFDRED